MSATRKPPADASGIHTWLVLMKAYRSLVRHAEQSIVAHELCLSDFAVLEMLLHKGPQKVNDIGLTAALTSGAITAAVDRLQERKLVVRTFDPRDRRSRVVKLTPRGEALIRDAFSRHATAMEGAAGGLGRSERRALVALLKKLGIFAERTLDKDDPQAGE